MYKTMVIKWILSEQCQSAPYKTVKQKNFREKNNVCYEWLPQKWRIILLAVNELLPRKPAFHLIT